MCIPCVLDFYEQPPRLHRVGRASVGTLSGVLGKEGHWPVALPLSTGKGSFFRRYLRVQKFLGMFSNRNVVPKLVL